MDEFQVRLLSGVGINGTVHRAGSLVTTNRRLALELIRRGKAELPAELAPNEALPELEDLGDDELKDVALEHGLKPKGRFDRAAWIAAIRSHEAT